MLATASPLQRIHEKEAEIKRRIEEARQQAEAQVQAARAEAEALVLQADQAGREEAEVLYRQGLDQSRREAEVILMTAHQQADTLHRRAMDRLSDAAGRIVELVLPAS